VRGGRGRRAPAPLSLWLQLSPLTRGVSAAQQPDAPGKSRRSLFLVRRLRARGARAFCAACASLGSGCSQCNIKVYEGEEARVALICRHRRALILSWCLCVCVCVCVCVRARVMIRCTVMCELRMRMSSLVTRRLFSVSVRQEHVGCRAREEMCPPV